MTRWLAAGIVTMALVGCGSSGGSVGSTSLRVQGSVAAGARTLDDARIVAVAADGRTHWAYVDAKGSFGVDVPVGAAYRLLLANARASGGLRVVGHLVIQTSHGASRWIAAPSGGTLSLGVLRQATSAGTAATTKGIGDSTSSDSSSSSDSSADGTDNEFDSHDDGSIGLCSEQDGISTDEDVELEASNDPGDAYADDHESVDDAESEGSDDSKACAPAPSPSTAPAPSGTTSAPPPPPASPAGGACTVTADCVSGLTCVASKCTLAIY